MVKIGSQRVLFSAYELQTGHPWFDAGLAVLLEEVGVQLLHEVLSGVDGAALDALNQKVLGLLARRTGKRQQEKRVDPADVFITVRSGQLSLKPERAGRCDLCAAHVGTRTVGAGVFPLALSVEKFRNFYSAGRRGLQLCPVCVASGYAAYRGCLVQWSPNGLLHLFILHADLASMRGLYRELIRPARILGQRRPGGPSQPSVAALACLLDVFELYRARRREATPAVRTLARLLGSHARVHRVNLTLYGMAVARRYRGFELKSVSTYTGTRTLWQLYVAAITQLRRRGRCKPAAEIRRAVEWLQRSATRTNSGAGERVARAVLTLDDPLPALEGLLFKVKPRGSLAVPRAGLELFEIYAEEVLAMDGDLLRTLAAFGKELGRRAKTQGEMGVLYTLRNARTLDQFLQALVTAQVRLGVRVPSRVIQLDSEDRIHGSPWQRVKTLLSIHALNAYLTPETESEEGKHAK